MAKRLTGENSLAYLGVNALTPSNFIVVDRAPTTNDYQNYDIGTFWLNSVTQSLYCLTNKDAQVATWSTFTGGSGGAITFHTDSGDATTSANAITIAGSSNINTSGASSTVTVALNNNISVTTVTASGDITSSAGNIVATLGNITSTAGSVSAATTVTAGTTITAGTGLTVSSFGAGVVQTDASGVFTSSNGTDGQLLISATAGVPAWANITSLGGSVIITNGANSINLEAGTSTPTTFTADSGTATPAMNNINIIGGTNIVTSASGSSVTIDLQATVPVSLGGTGATTLTANGVLYGNGTSAIGAVAAGTNGQVLTAVTGGAPVWGAAPVGVTWTDVTGTSAALVANNGYTANNAGLVTLTLPASASYGTTIRVVGKGAGGWLIAQNASQSIHFLGSTTTVGVAGSLASTVQYDCVELLCTVANLEWTVMSSMGNITIV